MHHLRRGANNPCARFKAPVALSKSLTRGRSPARLLLSRKSIDRSVGDNATTSPAQGRDVRRYPLSSLLPSAIRIASFPGSHDSVHLPGLGQDEIECSAIVAFQNVIRREAAPPRARPVFERRVAPRDVPDHEIDADVLEIIIHRRVARVIAERKIEQVLRRFQISVAVDRAREGSPHPSPR